MDLSKIIRHRSIAALLTVISTLSGLEALAAPPRLVVQIVISQMRYDYLERFKDNFSENGFRSFYNEGVVFENAQYDYMLTTTQAGLATITTGANPAIHGITGDYWIDPTDSDIEHTVYDSSVTGIGCDFGVGCYSATNLIAPTVGDKLRQHNPQSRIISIAIDPSSAIIAGGKSSDTYWLDKGRGSWISSTAFFDGLNSWVVRYNNAGYSTTYSEMDWGVSVPLSMYKNSKSSIIDTKRKETVFSFSKFKTLFQNSFPNNTTQSSQSGKWSDFSQKLYTPVGNKIVVDFASRAIISEELGEDEHTDLLTICFDSPRYISELFGPESIELEDSYYQLDEDIEQLLQSLYSRFDKEDVVVVLCSDHGSSNDINSNRSGENTFDKTGYMMIMNAFLSAQYEPGNWVLGYNDRQLYLNRSLIYRYGLNLEEVQNNAAAFSLQYRGISHAITSTALQNSYFGSGYAAAMYNSFYPRRAGDLTINLMPGWIEDREGICSASGSHYQYDTHVPLMFRGGTISPSEPISEAVDMTSVAPTLARIMGITTPDAATGSPLESIIDRH